MRTRMVMGLLMAAGLCIGGARVASAACVGGLPNGIFPQAGEQCDDGNNIDCGDACHNDCTLPTGCGDGHVCPGEVCDDGNTVDCDGCRNGCLSNNTCGNAFTDAACGTENCDDGNTVSCDGCDANCTAAACGNGVVCPPEVCDDGNTVFCDGCNNLCNSTNACGNAILDGSCGEVCDNGSSGALPNNGANQNCTNSCQCSTCGDSQVDTAGNGDTAACPAGSNFDTETCDDGNTINSDGCANSCDSTNACGNGIVDTGTGEQCDNGSSGPTPNNGADQNCTNSCQFSTCGDGQIDAQNNVDTPLHPNPSDTELCDDGNTINGDACANGCDSTNTCGNGIVDTGAGEECDAQPGICVGGTQTGVSCCSFLGTANCYTGGGVCRENGGTGTICCDAAFTTASTPSNPTCAGPFPANCGTCPFAPACNTISCTTCSDDHNANACRCSCQAAGCGDGVKDAGETCDDGFGSGAPGSDLLDDADSCPNGPNTAASGVDCRIATQCGDGSPRLTDSSARCACNAPPSSGPPCTASPGCPGVPACASGLEQCDAGGGSICVNGTTQPAPKRCLQDPTITCTADSPTCTCGNADTADHCRADSPNTTLRTACTSPKCGDGVKDTGEGCDNGAIVDGGTNSDTVAGACRTNCAVASCGDGTVDPPGEECDNGSSGTLPNNGVGENCTDTCQCSECGDGKVDTVNNPANPPSCPGASNTAVETCDDGNSSNNDACLNSCSFNTCGDGVVNAATCMPREDPPNVCSPCGTAFEQCDPNNTDGDGICPDDRPSNPENCSAGCCLYDPQNIPSPGPGAGPSLEALKCCLTELRNLFIERNVGALVKRVDKILKTVNKKLTAGAPTRKTCSGIKNVAKKIANLSRKIDQIGFNSADQAALQNHRSRCARWANRYGNIQGCAPIF